MCKIVRTITDVKINNQWINVVVHYVYEELHK